MFRNGDFYLGTRELQVSVVTSLCGYQILSSYFDFPHFQERANRQTVNTRKHYHQES